MEAKRSQRRKSRIQQHRQPQLFLPAPQPQQGPAMLRRRPTELARPPEPQTEPRRLMGRPRQELQGGKPVMERRRMPQHHRTLHKREIKPTRKTARKSLAARKRRG